MGILVCPGTKEASRPVRGAASGVVCKNGSLRLVLMAAQEPRRAPPHPRVPRSLGFIVTVTHYIASSWHRRKEEREIDVRAASFL